MFVFLCVGRPQCREDKCHLWDQNAPDVTPPKVNKPHNLDKQSCDIEKIAGKTPLKRLWVLINMADLPASKVWYWGWWMSSTKAEIRSISRGVTWASSEKCLWNRKCFYGADISPNQPSSFSAFIIVREMASSQLITQTNYTSPSIYKDYKTYFAWLWIIIFQDSTKKFQKWHPKQCSAKCELFTDVFLPTISEKTYLKICVLIYHSQKIALSQFLSDRSETM